jgi:hypothetical protein
MCPRKKQEGSGWRGGNDEVRETAPLTFSRQQHQDGQSEERRRPYADRQEKVRGLVDGEQRLQSERHGVDAPRIEGDVRPVRERAVADILAEHHHGVVHRVVTDEVSRYQRLRWIDQQQRQEVEANLRDENQPHPRDLSSLGRRRSCELPRRDRAERCQKHNDACPGRGRHRPWGESQAVGAVGNEHHQSPHRKHVKREWPVAGRHGPKQGARQDHACGDKRQYGKRGNERVGWHGRPAQPSRFRL